MDCFFAAGYRRQWCARDAGLLAGPQSLQPRHGPRLQQPDRGEESSRHRAVSGQDAASSQQPALHGPEAILCDASVREGTHALRAP